MKNSLLVCFGLLFSALLWGADVDKSLLKINGKETSLAEFEYYYRQIASQTKESPQHYFSNFVTYKLKVADARRLRMDTLPEFKKQYARIQANLLKAVLLDKAGMEALKRSMSEKRRNRFKSTDEVRVEEITLLLPQYATDVERRDADRRIDSIYSALKTGASFSELSEKYSEKKSSEPEWRSIGLLSDEFAAGLQNLGKGEFSKPFHSPLGVHIARLIDRRNGIRTSDFSQTLERYVEQIDASSPMLNRSLYEQWQNGSLEHWLPFRQAYDGLLAIYWDEKHSSPVVASPAELEQYFKAHKDDYVWEFPHFKGGVVHCLNKKAASKLKKRLKKLHPSEWNAAIQRLSSENPNLRAKVETGLFQIGKNVYVDKLAFKCGTYVPLKDYPYTFVIGKKLKKKPEGYEDVKEEVVRDCLQMKKREKLAYLQRYFTVEINEEVLKTVNYVGNN